MIKNYLSFNNNDKNLIIGLKSFLDKLDITEYPRATVYIGEGGGRINNTIQLDSESIKPNSTFDCISLSFNYVGINMSISLTRENSLIKLSLNVTNANLQTASEVIETIQELFPPFIRNESFDKLLGDELAEFYRKREEGLLRLETLSQNLIEDNQTYRNKLDIEVEKKKDSLISESTKYKENIKSEYDLKLENIKKREEELELKIKELDDRSSKHARRQIRKEIKEEIAKRNENFSLTKETIEKRKVIHIVFISFIISLGLMTGFTFYNLFTTTAEKVMYFETAKFVLSTVGLTGLILYYIRWNDNWFKRHADEEFNLKRFELDIERASWVVEMAMEWKDEKGTEIPEELLHRLTNNLFEGSASNKVTHPTEDILTKILGSSSEFNIGVGNLGNIRYDRKGVKRVSDVISKDN